MPVFRLKKAPQQPPSETLSLAACFAAWERPLLAYAFSILGRREVAQDVVQEAFLKLHQSEVPVTAPKAWLYRTVRNLAINTGKRRSRESSLEAQEEDSGEAPGDDSLPGEALERNEILGLARVMVDELDARARSVVKLKFEEGLSYKQIAERTGLSVSNVGYLLHHAVSSLAGEFERLGLR